MQCHYPGCRMRVEKSADVSVFIRSIKMQISLGLGSSQDPMLWPRFTRNRIDWKKERSGKGGEEERETDHHREWVAWAKNREDRSDKVDAWLRIWEEFSWEAFSAGFAGLLPLLIVFDSMRRQRKTRLNPSIHYWWLAAFSFLCNVCSHRQLNRSSSATCPFDHLTPLYWIICTRWYLHLNFSSIIIIRLLKLP